MIKQSALLFYGIAALVLFYAFRGRGGMAAGGGGAPAAVAGANAGYLAMPGNAAAPPTDPTGVYAMPLDPLPRGVPVNDPTGSAYCLLNPDDPACTVGPTAGIIRAF